MRMRFLSGRRGFVFAVAMSLFILPFAVAVADPGTGVSAEAVLSHDEGQEVELERAPRFARSNYVWSFEAGPYYGDVDAKQRLEAGTLSTLHAGERLRREAERGGAGRRS